jgi:predicted Mrr-cat superfamily restriction endonuclease
MSIRRGDMVLMPHPRRRQIAVGTVTGDYQHWPEGPDTANHIRSVTWLDPAVPRERFGDLLRWIDRPPTVSRVPVDDAASRIRRMLSDGDTIRLPGPQPAGVLHDF